MESSDPGASGKGDERKSKRARVESGGNASNEEVHVEENSNENDDDTGIEWDEYENEEIKPPEPPIPQAPSKEEWIQHQITHIPYKSWCPFVSKMPQ